MTVAVSSRVSAHVSRLRVSIPSHECPPTFPILWLLHYFCLFFHIPGVGDTESSPFYLSEDVAYITYEDATVSLPCL